MHPVTKPAREQIAIRLNTDGLAEVRRLAEEETEGNVSLMIRKLLREAISARQHAKR